MTPYTSFLYFGIALYVLIPVVLFGWARRFFKPWLLISTGIMLAVQYSALSPAAGILTPFWLLIGYVLFQWGLAQIFLLAHKKRPNRLFFSLTIFLSLLPLLVAKFAVLVTADYPLIFVGLSYLTFRSLDVIFGIQDGIIEKIAPLQYAAFLLFFPTISSGPIDRYQRFAEDWHCQRTREMWWRDLDGGIQRIFTGFLYKFILAALIKQYWLDPASQGSNIGQTISYMYAYTFYLFFDFAGYSAFAIGFSYFLGIHTPENFNRPFLARDMRDFWNRWHMSLSFWFRDHVYNRFVFAAVKGKWFKSRFAAAYLGYIISMGLMGIWHGTELHYIIYGLYHGILLTVTDWLSRRYKKNRLLNDNGFFWQAASILLNFHLVSFGFLIFSGRLF